MTASDEGLARLIERLAAIAQAGLAYSPDPYDRERFAQLQDLTVQLVRAVSGEGASLEGLYSDDVGYRTPKVDVRAVVFRGDSILLVRELIDGRWTVPGGWADIGESPSECALRELREEAGYRGRVIRLLALFDRKKHGHDPSPWHTYKAFFLCEIDGDPQETTFETNGVGFFAMDALPELSTDRVTAAQLRAFSDAVRQGSLAALYD